MSDELQGQVLTALRALGSRLDGMRTEQQRQAGVLDRIEVPSAEATRAHASRLQGQPPPG